MLISTLLLGTRRIPNAYKTFGRCPERLLKEVTGMLFKRKYNHLWNIISSNVQTIPREAEGI